jgi:ribosomal protein S18 acetylase RimI-like enzyme
MIRIIQADLDNPRHQRDLVAMLDAYAQDPMGGGEPMAEDVIARLVPGLRAHPAAYVFLAYRETPGDTPGNTSGDNSGGTSGGTSGGEAVGIANCFLGFSTFAAKPLINIHDLAVVPQARREGVGRKLLDSVAAKAKALGCCAVTLEVRDDNPAAQKLYKNYGFHDHDLPHRFWKLKL